MNLSEALDAVLPEIPKSSLVRSKPPMLDPDLITREEIMDGEPYVGVLQRGNASFYRLPLATWQLAQLFDGARSYNEIADLYSQQNGAAMTPEQVCEFAADLEEQNFWYKSAQEKNLAMSERLMAQRSRRAQRTSRFNVAHIYFSAWDPDIYLTRLDGLVGRLIYNPWSVFFAVALFIFEAFVYVDHWNVIGPDIPAYYSFAGKTLSDFAQFWILLFVLGFIHETAHGLTCKHFGGQVHSMGLMFLYLTPCFYVDVTESWIYASRVQRLWTIIAGIWIEMVVCGFAMIVWTNTDSGLWVHDFMYKLILITGVAVVVLNLNPLLKLDGYYFLTETMGMPELKERSTAFLTEWVQRHLLRMPVTVNPVPRKRVPLYVVYALLSGAYSYFVLFIVVRLAYNVSYKLIAEFAVIPAGLLAFTIFRSRLRSLGSYLNNAWLKLRHRQLHFNRRGVALFAIVVLLLVLPLWRDREDSYFVIEPANPVTVHSAIAGEVEAVYVKAGQHVQPGDALLKMTSVDASAMRAQAGALTRDAHFRSFEAQMHGQSVGTAAADQVAASQSRSLSSEATTSLLVRSPISGVILNADPDSLLGNAVSSGQSLLTVANDGPRLVRLYIPFSALKRISLPTDVLIMPPGRIAILQFHLDSIDSNTATLPTGFVPPAEYKGIALPTFYSARIPLTSPSAGLPLGAAGNAKILGQQKSILQRGITLALDLIHRHIWW